jgi:hypothetical protein
MDYLNGTVPLGAIAVIPIIIAIIQALKMTGWVKDRFAPLISIALGVLIGFIANHDSADLSNTILTGVTYGLSASGLYSGVKETANAKESSSASNTQK